MDTLYMIREILFKKCYPIPKVDIQYFMLSLGQMIPYQSREDIPYVHQSSIIRSFS